MDWLTTSTILSRLRDHEDRSVWDALAERFRQPIFNFARKLGLSPTDSDDAVQEILAAFMDAYRRDLYVREQGRLSHWLFGIAYRQIANMRRKRAREGARIDARGADTSFWSEVPDERDAQAAWDADWEKAMLEACLGQVRTEVSTPTYRAFELVVREGRTADEAASELQMSRNSVYVAKHRVLKRLEELVREYGES